jgi:hypothetical protein
MPVSVVSTIPVVVTKPASRERDAVHARLSTALKVLMIVVYSCVEDIHGDALSPKVIDLVPSLFVTIESTYVIDSIKPPNTPTGRSSFGGQRLVKNRIGSTPFGMLTVRMYCGDCRHWHVGFCELHLWMTSDNIIENASTCT